MWQVILDNNEQYEESFFGDTLTAWRQLKKICQEKGAKISKMIVDGKELDKNADSYFVMFSALKLMGADGDLQRQGFGSYRESSGQARVQWYDATSSDFVVVEIRKDLTPLIEEVGIEKAK